MVAYDFPERQKVCNNVVFFPYLDGPLLSYFLRISMCILYSGSGRAVEDLRTVRSAPRSLPRRGRSQVAGPSVGTFIWPASYPKLELLPKPPNWLWGGGRQIFTSR